MVDSCRKGHLQAGPTLANKHTPGWGQRAKKLNQPRFDLHTSSANRLACFNSCGFDHSHPPSHHITIDINQAFLGRLSPTPRPSFAQLVWATPSASSVVETTFIPSSSSATHRNRPIPHTTPLGELKTSRAREVRRNGGEKVGAGSRQVLQESH